MASTRGVWRYFRWPYHAAVMKALEQMSRRIVFIAKNRIMHRALAGGVKGWPPWRAPLQSLTPARRTVAGGEGIRAGRTMAKKLKPVHPGEILGEDFMKPH